MIAKPINGRIVAEQIKQEVLSQVQAAKVIPRLDVILVGDDPASKIYIRKKQEMCASIGIESKVHTDVNNGYDLIDKIEALNRSKNVHGILIQLPLPPDFVQEEFFDYIVPYKDVDVLHPENVGLLVQGRPRFRPCTPHGIQQLLSRNGIQVKGKHVVVISRSLIVGKPLSSMLMQDNDEYANATVTVCHDNTPFEELVKISKLADIVVVAVGIPGFLKANMVKPGCIVIDVGITRVGNKILGDVDIGVWDVAGHVTPVPGCVGLCTVAC